MSADLHIHVLKGIDESVLAKLKSNTLDSKYFNPRPVSDYDPSIYARVSATPNIWIGSVSWLKAALFESDDYIPDVVGAIDEIIGEDLPIIDDDLIAKISAAFELPNTTQYDIADASEVIKFLNQYRGEQVFTISW